MNKKLPKVFANNLGNINNNKNVFYSADDRSIKENTTEISKEIIGNTVEQKINNIFKATNYIYKAEVEIVLDNQTITKKIIGKNRNNLITMDNELIPIEKIKDIKYK